MHFLAPLAFLGQQKCNAFLKFALDNAMHLLNSFSEYLAWERSHSAGSYDVRTQIYTVGLKRWALTLLRTWHQIKEKFLQENRITVEAKHKTKADCIKIHDRGAFSVWANACQLITHSPIFENFLRRTAFAFWPLPSSMLYVHFFVVHAPSNLILNF
jgi:hypothetical protein